ncbi:MULTISPECIES: helix-turn-helix domain-containing protein [Sphingobacterium]|uniref:Transcriptional regulator n=1 Tax=Sphingobacterium multivorum TaxID=28454 RepID=A0A2X2JJ67_SPHMU|nr:MULTISPECIES: helix-turn-helix transcriptional regulator [Sphingobacterium]HAE68821.1 XRE family transcriptional regulator [Sphingobacterium sp.]OFV18380.1 transcriptional regulator [Sphingobacterium sp. HMSC13C05]QQT47470.1 helix-turn-helix transcriptional regulator [Sphingobacterium multivorum]QQT59949.1 helix-turn-helix transcriptional regulator [Sphingobacterium multivorum]QRQ60317.1 helix-turn-helix transcriptional regulator [Sphingobacterium multivorum]
MSTTNTTNHIGRKISRIRELRGMKQEALAFELGISQQAVSNMERNAEIEANLLIQVAEALGVTPQAIENFSEEAVFNYFNNFHDNSGAGAYSTSPTFTFNPADKLIEAYEENKKLYERLLEAEKSKVEYLERLLKDK